MRLWFAAGVAAMAFASVILAPTSARSQAFDAADEGQSAYVDGNLFFLTYHEVGHMILDQLLNIDQHGDRLASEEAADDIATWLMLPDPDEPDQDEEIQAAIEGWRRSAASQQGISQNAHYPDDATRAARIACYLYGSNPNLYSELADMFSVSINSVDCEEEVAVLEEDLQDWFGDHLIPPAESDGGSLHVQYESAPAALAAAQSYLRESGVLEDAAEDISQFVRLPNDVSVVARSCGRGAAEFRYSPSARRITACYEAVDWLMRDARDEQQDVSQTSEASGDEIGSGGARVPRRPRPRG